VVALRRPRRRGHRRTAGDTLAAGDTLVLSGLPEPLALAEAKLLPMTVQRRHLLTAVLAAPLPALADDTLAARLRAGGVVVAFRHALAPGTFDPPGFQLGDCSTQRNLNDEGRAQARRIGAWFSARRLVPARVRSSPWCRCIDTAQAAFGRAEPWPALGSPRAGRETTNAQSLATLRQSLADVARAPVASKPGSRTCSC
jgi:hypothetical protein